MTLDEYKMVNKGYDDLLKAMILTDTRREPIGGKVLCVYDTKESERLIAIFNSSKKLAQLLGTTTNVINSTISHKKLLFSRYLLKRVKVD